MMEKQLLKHYMKYAVILWISKVIIHLLSGNLITEIEENLFLILLLLYVAIIYFYIKNAKQHNFIHSLPITREVHWKILFLSGVIFITGMAVIYELVEFLYFFSVDDSEIIGTINDIFIRTVSYTVVGILVMTVLLWFVLHGLTIKRYISSVIILVFLFIVGVNMYIPITAVVMDYSGNNPLYILREKWNLLTIPREKLLSDCGISVMNYEPDFSNQTKWISFVIVIFISIVLTLIFYHLCVGLFERWDNSNDCKGKISEFSPAFLYGVNIVIGITIVYLGVMCSSDTYICTYMTIDNVGINEADSEVYKYEKYNGEGEVEIKYHGEEIWGNYYEGGTDYYSFEIYDIPDNSNLIRYWLMDNGIGVIIGNVLSVGSLLKKRRYLKK